ncbi:MAG: arginase [Rhodospirillaceae bacterium]|jgi:agmatinase|nr:arginase [Rhodospirillaceae bacterium]
MSKQLTEAPSRTPGSFLNFPLVTDLDDLNAHIAILGVPYGLPYKMGGGANPQSEGPDAIRAASDRITMGLDRWDFDVGGTLLGGKDIRVVDCGNVRGDAYDPAEHYRLAEMAARKIVSAGAMPIVIGGDHGIPIPIFRAFDGYGADEVTLVHIDAHIDWRDEINGVSEGYSSPIRRASEMDHFGEIYQLGIRGTGSAREEEFRVAEAYGANIITAYEIHDAGMDAIVDRIPAGGNYYITLDVDGLDPAMMPGVLAPVAGGLTFHQMRKLIHGLVAKGRVVGMDVNEFAPSYDPGYVGAVTCGQIITNLIGAAVHAGYFD